MEKKKKNNYGQYTKSELWIKRRERYYLKYGKVCGKCKATKSIQLHHKSYKNIGAEPDEDLIPLCLTCHKVFHRIFSKTSQDNTERFIEMNVEDYLFYKKQFKEERRQKKEEKKKKFIKEGKPLTYMRAGKFKMLSKKSINTLKEKAREEIFFDCLKNRSKK